MHHRPTSPPLSARLAAVGTRARLRAAAAVRRRNGRLGFGLLLLALVTGFVLAAPVVSGSDAPSGITLDASSAARLSDSPVVMGIDGRRTSSAFASASARLSMGPDGVRVEASASRSDRTALISVPGAPAPSAAEAPPSAGTPSAAPAPVLAESPTSTAEAPVRPAPSPAATTAPPTTLPGTPAPPPPAALPAESDRAGQVLAVVNRERAANGCRPVSADSRLTAVAAAHSADMRDRGFFDHINLAGLSPFDRADAAGVSARAENIARGQADATAVMNAWMASPGHRANILDCSLTRLGVGIADGGGGPWWTQLFG